ncbi:MAG: hypothetical protein J0M12_06340, partial [Deltaproteobacteria bacterium]|nr:hypothetical protein [Deltaproteobacteria bacterium]
MMKILNGAPFRLLSQLLVAAGLLFVSDALAQTDIYVRGSGKLFPIAMPQLFVHSGKSAANK